MVVRATLATAVCWSGSRSFLALIPGLGMPRELAGRYILVHLCTRMVYYGTAPTGSVQVEPGQVARNSHRCRAALVQPLNPCTVVEVLW